jgi:hypothetical protein
MEEEEIAERISRIISEIIDGKMRKEVGKNE